MAKNTAHVSENGGKIEKIVEARRRRSLYGMGALGFAMLLASGCTNAASNNSNQAPPQYQGSAAADARAVFPIKGADINETKLKNHGIANGVWYVGVGAKNELPGKQGKKDALYCFEVDANTQDSAKVSAANMQSFEAAVVVGSGDCDKRQDSQTIVDVELYRSDTGGWQVNAATNGSSPRELLVRAEAPAVKAVDRIVSDAVTGVPITQSEITYIVQTGGLSLTPAATPTGS